MRGIVRRACVGRFVLSDSLEKNGGEVGEGHWLSEEPHHPSTIVVPRRSLRARTPTKGEISNTTDVVSSERRERQKDVRSQLGVRD